MAYQGQFGIQYPQSYLPYAQGLPGAGGLGGGPGFDLMSFMGPAGFGLSTAMSVMDFMNAASAARDQRKDMRRAFEGTQANMRALLGISAGNVTDNEGLDYVGGNEDPRSRYLSTGTMVADPTLSNPNAGMGMHPNVVKARKMLYDLLQTEAYQPEAVQRMQDIGNRGIGQQLDATARAPAANANQAMGQLMNFGGAGQTSANTALQVALANRAFGNQVAQQGMGFLNSLYSAAGATI